MRRRGPIVLMRNVSMHFWASILDGDFSGCRMPGMVRARCRWLFLGVEEGFGLGGGGGDAGFVWYGGQGYLLLLGVEGWKRG
jgi:hypothetical protein